MTDLLSLTVKDTFNPGIIALVCQGEMFCQVLHTRSIAKLIGRLVDDLENNKYRNREIQSKYNIGELEIKLLDYVDLSNIESGNIKDLVLRHVSNSKCSELQALGWRICNQAPFVEMTVSTVLENRVKARSPQVAVTLARGTKYYVQKPFNSILETEEYIANTDLMQLLIDTNGSRKPFYYVVPRELRPVREAREDRRKYNKGRKPFAKKEESGTNVETENSILRTLVV